MQQFSNETKSSQAARHCAEALAEAAPRLMQRLRQGMRQGRGPDLSVPQFRVLVHTRLMPGATLSAIAEQVGVSTPTASRLVDTLVARGLLSREHTPEDRRRVAIALTAAGEGVLAEAHLATVDLFENELRGLLPAELAQIAAALAVVGRVFQPGPAPGNGAHGAGGNK